MVLGQRYSAEGRADAYWWTGYRPVRWGLALALTFNAVLWIGLFVILKRSGF